MMSSRVLIVTPCFNTAETISRTIASVVTQEGDCDLHYHVQDGGSSDGTLLMIQHWERLIADGALPLACNSLRFTWQSGPDGGIYDAICRGVEALDPELHDWIGWINADDILMPGTAALLSRIDATEGQRQISWVSGGMGIVSNGTVIAHGPRRHNSEILQLGLADGRHWEYVQQEGVFFRHRLWRDLDLEADFRSMKYAGDWNLWRRLAERHDLYQVDRPLGGFRLRDGQISERFRGQYEAETEALVPLGRRLQALRALRYLAPSRRVISFTYPNAEVFTRDESMEVEAHSRLAEIVGPQHDDDWGVASTERRAFEAVRDTAPLVSTVAYVAFPWTTLIDQLEQGAPQSQTLRTRLRRCAQTQTLATKRVTVCQHPRMLEHRALFAQCGVTDVFWSHASEPEAIWAGEPEIIIRPFPVDTGQDGLQGALDESEGRGALFWIADDDAAAGRWSADINRLRAAGASAGELGEATFAIFVAAKMAPDRLWQAIAAGTVPVFVGRHRGLPGSAALWEEAAIFAASSGERGLANLPDQLACLAKDVDALARKRWALRQLQLLYGSENLIHDIRRFYVGAGGGPAWSRPGQTVEERQRRVRLPQEKLRVCLHGRGGGRSPLASTAYRKYLEEGCELVSDPEAAQVVVAFRTSDFALGAEALQGAARNNPALKFVVLSAEPQVVPLPEAGAERNTFDVVLLDPSTSDIFEFRRLPYALTTSDECLARYNFLFGRPAPRPRELKARWDAALWRTVLDSPGAENEPGAAKHLSDGSDLREFRTVLSERATGERIWRVSAGQDDKAELYPDAQLGKLARLRGRAFLMSALESMHHPRFVTRRIFDAFACDAAPIYYASPFHGVHRLVQGGMVNLFDLSPDSAAAVVQEQIATYDLAEAWLATREDLAALFCDPVSLEAERKQVAERTLGALNAVLQGAWVETPAAAALPVPVLGPSRLSTQKIRILDRHPDRAHRYLDFELVRPSIGDIQPDRLRFRFMILQTGVFGLEIERRHIVPHDEGDELGWRLIDGAPLSRLSVIVNSENRRVLWSETASRALHRFVAAIAKDLPDLLRASGAEEGGDEIWLAAAATLRAVGQQWLAQA